jgi:predicted nucleic acid-binding protein
MVGLVGPALELAVASGCTAYDAAYVALAQQVDLPLVTADAALVRRFAGSEVVVQALGDIEV